MRTNTFARVLRAFCRRRPFRHFVIEFHTGGLLKIVHPELLIIEDGGIVHYVNGRYHRLFDASSVSQLMDLDE